MGKFEPHEWVIEAEDSLPYWCVRVRRITENEIRYHTTIRDKSESKKRKVGVQPIPQNIKLTPNYKFKPEFKKKKRETPSISRNVEVNAAHGFKPEFKKKRKGNRRFPKKGVPPIPKTLN